MAAPAMTVIGLDAATFDVIGPLVEAGELPALARILESGASGTLRSTLHPLTPQAWTTMVTGVNAGRHGIWDFTERDASGYRLRIVNGSHRRSPALWDYLAAHGRSVGIVNIPFTGPAPAVMGFAVAGLDAAPDDAGITYPRELAAELTSRFGRLDLDHSFPLDDDGRVSLDLVRRACEQKVAMSLWLAERFQPDLLFVVFMSADHIHHLCWPEWEREGVTSRVADVYRILDEAVSSLLDALGWDQDVLVVSDHGGGMLDGVVNLNAWLAEQGYLAYAMAHGMVTRGETARRALDNLYQLRRKLPRGLRVAARRRFPGFRNRVHVLRAFSVIDWDRTQVFAYGTFGSVVINRKGREGHGIVEPEDYDSLRQEVAERLLSLQGPDGRTIVAAVHRREELFDGPELERLPDLIVEFDEYRWLGKGNLKARTPTLWDEIPIAPGSRESYVGSHRLDGIVAMAGRSVTPRKGISADIRDITPTVLYLLGAPIPLSLEGRVLEEALDPALLDSRPPQYEEAPDVPIPAKASPTFGAEEVEARLRNLGYLE